MGGQETNEQLPLTQVHITCTQSILLSERKSEILISTFRTHPIYVICNDFWWSVVNPRENEAMLGTYLGFLL